uniref:Protein regulator of cytokinesis 1 n=1 Tax=Caenorhabditis japonica TaxID=281687 RepID=A0A8R1HIP8_CAEJA
MSRRKSVFDAHAAVNTKIRETVSELNELWDEVDMSDSMRLKRVDNAFTHITQLCDDMLAGEKEMVHDLKVSIREDMKSVVKMRNELELDAFQRPAEIRDGSIALMRHLQSEVKRLEVEFQKRHEDQRVLIEKICGLKKRLASDFEFEYETHSLFPLASYQKYEKNCEEMEELLRQRYSVAEQRQQEMRQWKEMAGRVAEYVQSDDDLKELLEKNVDSEDFVFSEQLIECLEAYHQDLRPLYMEWLEDIEFRWTEKHQQLADLWEKCLVAPVDRHFRAVFEPSRQSEENLGRMIEECERLERKYSCCKTVFDLVDKWKSVWNEKLGIDEKRRQPDYYKKVNVLPDNKRERELQCQMPHLEKEIQKALRKYEKENAEEPISVQGMHPIEYIRFIEEEHKKELKFELQLKKEEKTRMQSPQPQTRTPRTQKRAAPLFRTPLSSAKLEPVAKFQRLNFDRELPPCMSPVTSEALSFITPTRKPPAGPITSSPKEGRAPTQMSKRAMTPSSVASSSSKLPLARRNAH